MMNHVSARGRYDEEISRIQEIVRRHAFPPSVTGFHAELGEFDGDPVIRIYFKIEDRWIPDELERKRDADELNGFIRRVQPDLLDAFQDRFPHFRFVSALPTSHDLI